MILKALILVGNKDNMLLEGAFVEFGNFLILNEI
jgi:hypothetical protein